MKVIACVLTALLAMTAVPAVATSNAGKTTTLAGQDGMDVDLPEAASINASDAADGTGITSDHVSLIETEVSGSEEVHIPKSRAVSASNAFGIDASDVSHRLRGVKASDSTKAPVIKSGAISMSKSNTFGDGSLAGTAVGGRKVCIKAQFLSFAILYRTILVCLNHSHNIVSLGCIITGREKYQSRRARSNIELEQWC